MNLTEQNFQILEKSFKDIKPKKVKTKPCRVMFNGKFVTTNSNKTVWRNIGFAKLAIVNHFQMALFNKDLDNIFGGYSSVKDGVRELEEMGIIKYVETDIEDFASSKRS